MKNKEIFIFTLSLILIFKNSGFFWYCRVKIPYQQFFNFSEFHKRILQQPFRICEPEQISKEMSFLLNYIVIFLSSQHVLDTYDV